MTMSRPSASSVVRLAAPALGFALAALLLLSLRIAPASGELGTDVRLVAAPAGELAVEHAGAFASGRALEPGAGEVHGRLVVTNVAGAPLAVRLRVLPSNRALDRLLRVKLTSDGRTLASGRLAGLRAPTRRAVVLPARGEAELEARAWLPRGASDAGEGRAVDLTLELNAEPLGAP